MFIVMFEAASFVDVLEVMVDEAQCFDTLDEALQYVQDRSADMGHDPHGYTIWTPHPVKVTVSI